MNASLVRCGLALVFLGGSLWSTAHARVQNVLPEPFNPATMDTTADACSNFFEYATGGWRKAHPIPPDRVSYGYTEALDDINNALIRATLEAARRRPGANGSTTQKIGNLYGSCMDAAAIERAGLEPLAPILARIAALASPGQLPPLLAYLETIGVDAGLGVNATQDTKNSALTTAELDQGGLGLPERDYYVRTDPDSRKLRAQYVAHVGRTLALAGDASAPADAARIMAFETRLALASTPAAALRDPAVRYHPMSEAKAATLAPRFGLVRYLRANGAPRGAFINVAEPGFVRAFGVAQYAVPLETWRAYLRWRLVDTLAPALPKRFDDEHFAFAGKILLGQQVQRPRWKRCVAAANSLLGFAVGRAYVDRTFTPLEKARATQLAQQIRAAYEDEIAGLDWMSAPTKKIARAKLDAMGFKVGYPAKWRSYAGYDVGTNFATNAIRGRAFENAYELAKIGKPLDRTNWDMTPQTVNAYNDVGRNEIVITAAILQRPFYDATQPDSDNLGATGAGTLGHEMTHGFDDEGHKFDSRGNLHNWWTPADLLEFTKHANCVIDQLNDTAAVGNVHYQGKLDAGEAIADLGGTEIGYHALETALGPGPHAAVDGFTPEQRYFLSFAQSWTESERPQADLAEARSDPHPIPRDRVNLTVHNVPGWYAAFNCPKPPQPLCHVW